MIAVPRIIGRQDVRNASFAGDCTFWPRSTACRNTGVSSSFRRIHRPRITITALSRNGRRQPHSMNAPCVSPFVWPSTVTMIRNSPLVNRKPSGAPSCGHIAAQPRLPSSAVSVASSAAPDDVAEVPEQQRTKVAAALGRRGVPWGGAAGLLGFSDAATLMAPV